MSTYTTTSICSKPAPTIVLVEISFINHVDQILTKVFFLALATIIISHDILIFYSN